MEQNIYIICGAFAIYILMFLGALGSFLPVIPGPLIAGLGLLGFKLIFPMSISWWLVIAGIIIAVFSQIIDIVATWLGAKKFGATWRGTLGAFIGVFIGMFLPPPLIWIFIAPLVCALLFELLGGADIHKATNAGIGALVGTILASVIKFLMVVFLAVWFSFEIVMPLFK
jgi:uncharacterized protein YqgC (DUF456 family)